MDVGAPPFALAEALTVFFFFRVAPDPPRLLPYDRLATGEGAPSLTTLIKLGVYFVAFLLGVTVYVVSPEETLCRF